MKSRVLLCCILLGGLACVACGDDDDTHSDAETGKDAGDAPARSSSSAGGTGGAGSRSSSSAGGAATPSASNPGLGAAVSVECGSKTCTSPGGFAAACCVDPEAETCGMSFMGGGCSVPEAGDERCPSVSGFVMLPSCCTDKGMCGISAAMFGMPGCIELSEAKGRAQMSSASAFPESRACDGSSTSSDGDAGTPDADSGT